MASWVSRRLAFAAVVVVLVALGTACEHPTPLGMFTTYAAAPSRPQSIVATADGTVWFANGGNGSIGRRSPNGTIANFFPEGCGSQTELAIGPDGNVWFVCFTNMVGTISPAGAISTFGAGVTAAVSITTGPDGNLWYVGGGGLVGRRTPAGLVTVYPGTGLANSYPQRITAGPDGNLWYTTNLDRVWGLGNPTVVRLTTAGVATAFTDPALHPGAIAAGADGNLWFTNGGDSIGRITPSGAITVVHDPAISSAKDIVAGPDGNLWFANGGPSIGRLTTAGAVTAFTDPALVGPARITATSQGMWFTDRTSFTSGGVIGHITTAGTFEIHGPGAHFPGSITKGFDDSVWFANRFGDEVEGIGIGRIDADGTTQVFHATNVGIPYGIAPSPDGSAWVSTGPVDSIVRVSPAGAFTVFEDPSIRRPIGITRGTDGNVWFANYDTSTIGRITPSGSVTAFADPAIQMPLDMTTAADGGMWFTNSAGSTVGRIDTTGAVRSFVLPAVPTFITSSGNDLWFTVNSQNLIGRITPAGVVTTFTDPVVYRPGALAADAAGNIYFGNDLYYGNDSFASIGRMTPGGTFTIYRAPGIGPIGMVGGFGDIWFTNGVNNSVTRFGTAG